MRLNYSNVSLSRVSAGQSMESLSSLRVMIIMRERKRQLTKIALPERILNNKLEAYRFVDLLRIRRPKLITGKATHDALPAELQNVVIKPLHGRGSRGVYAVFNENLIKQVKTAETFSGREALVQHLKADLQAGVTKDDRWIVEELIADQSNPLVAARDLKFYCFYGRVAHVMEVVRDPSARFCFWDADCKLKDVGGTVNDLFTGRGFTPEMRQLAERISAEIPAPFLRIDFHATGSEMVFCEFTPTSGAIWEYDKETDQLLGDYYLEAEARLLTDLLNGKRFDAYNAYYRNYLKRNTPESVQLPEAAALA